ncbi:MAG: DegV family protein [Anaerolineae bacterium]|nr:DegV family protein [Anaerolineae bacterium]
MARILVVVDSTCDLPAEIIQQYDIRIIPTYVQFGLESLADDGEQLTRETFYARLPTASPLPTSSAPPLGQSIEIMEQALADADHVIALTAPAKLSGVYNVFRLAVERTDPQRVTLIDGQQLSMGLGWQALIAAEMTEEGYDPAAIRDALIAMQPRIHVWAALDTLEYVRRSGRVGWASAIVGEFLRIKPIIHLYMSDVRNAMRVRTSQRAFQALIDLARNAAPFDRLAVMHTCNPDGAKRLADALRDLHPDFRLITVEATPVLGVHVGPNGLGLGVVRTG